MDWGRLAVRALAVVVVALVLLGIYAMATDGLRCGLFARGTPGDGC